MTSKIIVNNIGSDTGINTVTFDSNVVRGGSNLHSTGLALGAGSTVGAVTGVTTYYGDGSQLTNLPAGNLTGTLPALDGSALTGVGLGTDGSANTSGIITATAFVPTTQQLSHRNLIINGDFRIAQRGYENSYSSTANGYKTVDRWSHNAGGTGVTVTFSQQSTTSSDTPYQNGFSKFFRIALSGAGTANANAYAEVLTKLEAQDIANSGWNFKSSSSNITLSFWVRPSTNQTFYGFIRSYDGTSYAYAFSFTASGNNTWTKITKTISGNSNLDFNDDNNEGLHLVFVPFYGTDFTNNKTLDAWAASDNTNFMPDMASTWLTAGASTFDITGVQLEVGSVATDFEHRSYAQELQLCKRYYEVFNPSLYVLGRYSHASGAGYNFHSFEVQKRDVPTISFSGTFSSGSGYAGDPIFSSADTRGVAINSTNTVAANGILYLDDSGSAFCKFDAEL